MIDATVAIFPPMSFIFKTVNAIYGLTVACSTQVNSRLKSLNNNNNTEFADAQIIEAKWTAKQSKMSWTSQQKSNYNCCCSMIRRKYFQWPQSLAMSKFHYGKSVPSCCLRQRGCLNYNARNQTCGIQSHTNIVYKSIKNAILIG